MVKTELISITPAELERMMDESNERILAKYKSEAEKPSEYEDITLEQAAKELRCSVRTIRRRMKELNMKGYKVGKLITIQRKDLKKIKLAS
jgi:excisionase family DNA binding protein